MENVHGKHFEYDVAFSFLASDEDLASRLNDLIKPRLTTFLYSKRQTEIAGADGEQRFNAIFGNEARTVVILYRKGWGETPWTRIEETAIRNRAYDEGYDFALFIPLDTPATVPPWLPRTRLWLGLDRWGLEGAASVIEARVQEAGGQVRVETFEEKTLRLKREIDAEEERKRFLSSVEGVRAATTEIRSLHKQVQRQLATLKDTAGFNFTLEFHRLNASLIGNKFSLSIDWTGRFLNTLDGSKLEVTLWHGPPHRPGMTFLFEQPKRLKQRRFQFDRDWTGAHGWREKDEADFLSTERLAELCITFLMEHIHGEALKG